jgi:hypothetical protein
MHHDHLFAGIEDFVRTVKDGTEISLAGWIADVTCGP